MQGRIARQRDSGTVSSGVKYFERGEQRDDVGLQSAPRKIACIRHSTTTFHH